MKVTRTSVRWIIACGVVLMIGLGVVVRWVIPEPLPSFALPVAQAEVEGRKLRIVYPGYLFVTEVGAFRDELYAYLMLQYHRSSKLFMGRELILHLIEEPQGFKYEMLTILGEDEQDAAWQAMKYCVRPQETCSYGRLPKVSIAEYRSQTALFDAAYSAPVDEKLEDVPPEQLQSLLRRFIRFKSATDPRIGSGTLPKPSVLTSGAADQIAGDIITVSRFFELPLDVFLGIGAMENNYMNVRGDLRNSAWKRHPAKDDIVLQRAKGRVRVLNDSTGACQITRETLRFVHSLYLGDTRDYSLLPVRLRPQRELTIEDVPPGVLTTYAGLLLRNLLDHFNGDVRLAVGAYNGGPGRPNMNYERGVQKVAEHARSVLERAAALSGESVLQRKVTDLNKNIHGLGRS